MDPALLFPAIPVIRGALWTGDIAEPGKSHAIELTESNEEVSCADSAYF